MARRAEERESVRDSVRSKGGTAEFISCDVSNPEDIAEAVDKTIDLYEGVDFLFNNTGTAEPETFLNETQAQ